MELVLGTGGDEMTSLTQDDIACLETALGGAAVKAGTLAAERYEYLAGLRLVAAAPVEDGLVWQLTDLGVQTVMTAQSPSPTILK